MDKSRQLLYMLNIIINTIVLNEGHELESSSVSENPDNSEFYTYMDPLQYSLLVTIATIDVRSVQRCASRCIREPSCDGFFYGGYSTATTTCVLGSDPARFATTAVDPANFRMYIRKSYVFITCPTEDGFREVSTGLNTYCLLKNSKFLSYVNALSYCQGKGATLFYMDGDVLSNLHFFGSILSQLGAQFKTFWVGAYQRTKGNDEWVWAYTGNAMTSQEYDSYDWRINDGNDRKCMEIDTSTSNNKVTQRDCTEHNEMICEIVLF